MSAELATHEGCVFEKDVFSLADAAVGHDGTEGLADELVGGVGRLVEEGVLPGGRGDGHVFLELGTVFAVGFVDVAPGFFADVGELVGADADDVAVEFVGGEDDVDPFAAQDVVDVGQVGECEVFGTGIFGEWVEV